MIGVKTRTRGCERKWLLLSSLICFVRSRRPPYTWPITSVHTHTHTHTKPVVAAQCKCNLQSLLKAVISSVQSHKSSEGWIVHMTKVYLTSVLGHINQSFYVFLTSFKSCLRLENPSKTPNRHVNVFNYLFNQTRSLDDWKTTGRENNWGLGARNRGVVQAKLPFLLSAHAMLPLIAMTFMINSRWLKHVSHSQATCCVTFVAVLFFLIFFRLTRQEQRALVWSLQAPWVHTLLPKPGNWAATEQTNQISLSSERVLGGPPQLC